MGRPGAVVCALVWFIYERLLIFCWKKPHAKQNTPPMAPGGVLEAGSRGVVEVYGIEVKSG